MSESLKQRVLRAGAWTIGGHAGSQILRLVSSLVMTRLLVPEMFGVMTIAYVFMTGLAMFSDIGIVQNVVQSRRGSDTSFLRTAWTVQILRGALVFLIALLVASAIHLAAGYNLLPINSVYADAKLPHVLALISLSGLIAGFESMRLALARRNLDLARVARIEIMCQALSLAVMIFWALFDQSIWALVAGGLVGAITRTLLTHMYLPGVGDRCGWDPVALREIIAFGKWVFLSSLIGFLVISGDRLILGGLVNAQELGIYSIAAMLVGAIEALLTKLIGDVALPAFSEVSRNRPEQLRQVFYRVHFTLGSVALFLAGALLTSGPAIVRILYDDRYANAGWMLGIIALGLITVPARIATQCFLAGGKSRVVAIQAMIRLPALYLITPAAFQFFGMLGALWSIVLSALTCIPIMWVYQIRAGLFDARREAAILPAFLGGLALGQVFSLGVRQFA
jgi:O-antigen/teichoic acid export membrane protein